jgi:hypothetical protein
MAPLRSTSSRAAASSVAQPIRSAAPSTASSSVCSDSRVVWRSPVSRSASSPSTPQRHALQRFSSIRQLCAGGPRSPASWRSASQATSACASAATAPASRSPACASGTRTSSVPNAGCGRSSHHQRRGSGTAPAAAPQRSASAKVAQSGIAGGTPWRGSSSEIFGRIDAIPVSRPA